MLTSWEVIQSGAVLLTLGQGHLQMSQPLVSQTDLTLEHSILDEKSLLVWEMQSSLQLHILGA